LCVRQLTTSSNEVRLLLRELRLQFRTDGDKALCFFVAGLELSDTSGIIFTFCFQDANLRSKLLKLLVVNCLLESGQKTQRPVWGTLTGGGGGGDDGRAGSSGVIGRVGGSSG
jgi:hypothetical protein